MPRVTFVTNRKAELQVDATDGETLLEIALANGISGITGDCGGEMSCGTCHVQIAANFFDLFPAPSSDEQIMLEDGVVDPQPTSRLSCQIVIDEALDGIVVTVPQQF